MDEIKKLQELLQSVQKQDVAQRLSERNCVDLIMKLLERDLIKLLFTQDGKEYLTYRQLEREIMDELLARGGRASLVDIHDAINVDLSHVQDKVNEILAHDSSLQRFEAQILTKEYLDGVAEEINTALQEVGQIATSELAKKYEFTTAFFEEVMKPRCGVNNVMQGQIEGGMLYTQAYIQRQKARVRGLMTAITRPVPVATLLCTYQIQEKLFNSVVNDLVASGRLKGSIQSREWVPAIFLKHQEETVDRFFAQNRYIGFDVVSRMQVHNPKTYLSARLGDKAVCLSSCFVASELIASIEASVEDTVSSNTWVSVTQHLPPMLTAADGNEVLRRATANLSKGGHESFVVDEELCLVSKGLLDNCNRQIDQHAKDNSERLHRLLVVEAAPPVIADARGPEPKGKAKGKGRGKHAEEEEGKKKEKVFRGTGGREKKAPATNKKKELTAKEKERAAELARQASGTKAAKGAAEMKAEHVATEMAAALGPLMKELEVPEALQEAIRRHLRHSAQSVFEKAAHSVFASGHKAKIAAVQEPFATSYNQILLYSKAATQFGPTPPELLVLERHLIKKTCVPLAALLFHAAAQEMALGDSPTEAQLATPEARTALLPRLPPALRPALTDLHQTLAASKKGVSDLLAVIDTVVTTMCLQVPVALDKNKERQVVFAHRQAWLEQLGASTDAGVVLLLVLQLLIVATHKALLHVPWRAAESIIEQLAPHVSADVVGMLRRLHGRVNELRAATEPGLAREMSTGAGELPLEEGDVALMQQVRDIVSTKEALAAAVKK